MKENDFRTYAKHYDHIYLKKNDYRKETEIIKDIIEQFEDTQSKTLLDVGCGTGELLKYLSTDFRCTGIDINRGMINTAKETDGLFRDQSQSPLMRRNDRTSL
jgi:predicted TPR repeat methyltransferase